MRIIARNALTRYIAKMEGRKDERALKASLDSWYHEVKGAQWNNSSEVKASYASASIVGGERVVFNIRGNAYRLVVAVDYQRSIVFIKWLGTHKEYNAINVRTVQYAPETH